MEFFKDLEFKPIECPKRGGIDFPCVICQQCEIGEVEVILEEDFLIEKTVNSAIISMLLKLEDEFEEVLLGRFLQSLGSKTSLVMKKPMEGYQVSFFIDQNAIASPEKKRKTETFIQDFTNMWKSAMTKAKSVLNKWERDVVQDVTNRLP